VSELAIVFGGVCIVAIVALLRSESLPARLSQSGISRRDSAQAGGDCGPASEYGYMASDGSSGDGGSADCGSADSGGGCDGGGGGD
jgi:hypothetical protein